MGVDREGGLIDSRAQLGGGRASNREKSSKGRGFVQSFIVT